MRIAFFSDIHGNLEALNSVLDFLKGQNIDKIHCLGDIVGYGPNPHEVLNIIKDYDCILGNHDAAAYNIKFTSNWNKYAIEAMKWTTNQLTEEDIDFLTGLDYTKVYKEYEYTLTHGSLVGENPFEFEYIEFEYQAKRNFKEMMTQLLFVGHSHTAKIWAGKEIPVSPAALRYSWIIHSTNNSTNSIKYNEPYKLDNDKKYIINVGSIGQPRDNDPRSCIVIYDTDQKTIEYKRVSYNIEVTRQVMIDKGLNERLYNRILKGE